jgi:hypothetical protein
MLITCCKLLLSLVAALTMGTAFSPTVLIVVACLVSLTQLYATVCYQPLFNVEWNKINGGLAAVFAWASASTLTASQRDRPDDQVGAHPLKPLLPFTNAAALPILRPHTPWRSVGAPVFTCRRCVCVCGARWRGLCSC